MLLLQVKCVTAYFAFGLNDFRFSDSAYTPESFQADYEECIQLCIDSGVSPSRITIGAPYYIPPAQYSNYSPFNGGSTIRHIAHVDATRSVAKKIGCKWVNLYQEMINNGGDSLISGDGIHPNNTGHSLIATLMRNASFVS